MSPQEIQRRQADMHFRNAAKAWKISIEEVTPEQRQFAKQCAFGARGEEDAFQLLEIGLRLAQLHLENEERASEQKPPQ